ncbi:histidine-type phosphatase [Sphingomonas flavalba]|uniref:histidine-type phosphatase n=1 Tax=Sphingomonas flavalba TaxID=2559804 RepID=UPI00109DE809|nr:histidine-type phosphatase [Sphingomonas flavalba]
MSMHTAIRAMMGVALAAMTAGGCAATDSPANADGLALERVVFVMRHGIRPPTKDPAKGTNYTSDPWPAWPVDYGLLTPRGAAGIRLLGTADRAEYVKRGLIPANGCLTPGAVDAEASAKQRAIKTGEAYLETLLPGCVVAVAHPEKEGPEDAIFHPLDSGPADFDGARGHAEALALAPAGGLPAEAATHRAEIDLLGTVLGCCSATVCAANGAGDACTLADLPTTLAANPHDRPDLEGPLVIGSTISQTLLLEYLEGMPMSDVGWGRVTRDQIEQLLVFHPVKFRYENGSPYVAQRAAGPLVSRMLGALTAGADGARLTLLFGHDTNLADIGSLLGLDWQVPSYPKDDIPPGGALGFELLRDGKGQRFVRAFFRAQTMDQLREQQALDPDAPGYRAYLPIPGCNAAGDTAPCPIDRFTTVVKAKLAGS